MKTSVNTDFERQKLLLDVRYGLQSIVIETFVSRLALMLRPSINNSEVYTVHLFSPELGGAPECTCQRKQALARGRRMFTFP